jgi:hypothetical protein
MPEKGEKRNNEKILLGVGGNGIYLEVWSGVIVPSVNANGL